MKKWVRMMALALSLVSLFAVSGVALAAEETVVAEEAQAEATVTGNASLREKPSGSADRIVSLKKGATVTVLDSSNKSWWKVRTADGQEGYLGASYIQLAGDAAQEDKKAGSSAVSSSKDVNAAKIAAAKKKNSDVIGWINVPNTNIDDPILYAPNFYYANYNIDKKKSLEGVYPYYNKLTKNIALFGHNLRGSGKGMHALHHMQETALGYSRCQNSSCGRSLGSTHKNWQKENRVWNISLFGKTKWEVFAMYEVKANEPISTLRNNWSPLSGASESAVQKWLDGQLKRSEIDFGVSVSPKDTFLTIITCGTNYDSATANSRLFVFLKCVG